MSEPIYVSPCCRIVRSGDGGYIVWTRARVEAGWRAAPIPGDAVGAMYRLVLMQYRAVTEDATFATAAEASERFGELYHETYG